MNTPKYDELIQKIRAWSLRSNSASLPDTVIQDCLTFGLDDVYRELRIPQLEYTMSYTVTAANNSAYQRYTVIDLPQDTIELIYLMRVDKNNDLAGSIIYNTVADIRTFLDPYAEQYSMHRMVIREKKLLIHPQLAVGDNLELHYYRRLPSLDALYSVEPDNYSFEFAYDEQPLLIEVPQSDDEGKALYLVDGGAESRAFLDITDANTYRATNGGGLVIKYYVGREAWNWFKDSNQNITLSAALKHVGRWLQDDAMQASNSKMLAEFIFMLNKEEKFRKARGGNVQMNINTGGLI